MTFNCGACKLDFQAEKINVARITISCPVCAANMHIAQSLTRVYGKLVGEQITKIMSTLENLLGRSRSGDMTPHILRAQRKIEKLCEARS